MKMSALFFPRHGRIVGALMMRELITRYGREGLGFLWLIGEPLMFCLGVLLMWHIIKPEYEHGVRLGPFIMTGYMSLLLMRHQISYSLSAIQANIGLLHHRRITVLHLYLARNLLEFAGATGAFVIAYLFLAGLGQVSAPHDWLLLYGGWLLLGWMSMGLAITLSALALRFEVMERVVPLLTYALIPISGVFFMVAWIPAAYQDAFLLLPFPHPIEMIRAGVFGEFVPTRYHPLYALGWSAVFNFAGLILLAGAKDRIDAE
jgi:capsular polysaccharide transport system permease protein